MIYAIYACECLYEGEHGMNDVFVAEFKSDEAAIDCAREMSYEVMDSYECIGRDLWEEVLERIEYGASDDRAETERIEVYMENLSYDVWLIDPKGQPLEELNDMAYNNYLDLIETHGIKCIAQV